MTSVLIVDDDASFRTTIGRDLAAHGFAVSQAQNVDEALGALAERSYDVLLTDLRMPGADGIDLLTQVRTLSARTRAILMSGFASARDYQRAIELGAVRVLCKPFTSSELLQAIRQAVDCETGFRGSIHGLSLVDLLQMFHYARRTLAIVVDGWDPGHVFVQDGQLVHALYRELEGEAALRAILAMPAGSLRTMVMPDDTPRTIARDFQTLLLDSLRTLDEDSLQGLEGELAEFDETGPVSRPSLARFLERLRHLDGYAASMLIDIDSGVMLGGDGDGGIDLQIAAAGYGELIRLERAAVARLGGDRLEDVVLTMARQYHVLHALPGEPGLLLGVILDRTTASLGLARYALAAADRGDDA